MTANTENMDNSAPARDLKPEELSAAIRALLAENMVFRQYFKLLVDSSTALIPTFTGDSHRDTYMLGRKNFMLEQIDFLRIKLAELDLGDK